MSGFHWQEIEAEHSAEDLFFYCLRTFDWRSAGGTPLCETMRRFRKAVENRSRESMTAQDYQYLRRSLVRMLLRGAIERGCSHFDLAMDRLEWLEREQTAPAHQAWLLTDSVKDRLYESFGIVQEFDFVTGLGVRCDCGRAATLVVIHDGTPTSVQLQIAALFAFDHGCGTGRSLAPVHIGDCCTSEGGANAVAADMLAMTREYGPEAFGPFGFSGFSLVPMKVTA